MDKKEIGNSIKKAMKAKKIGIYRLWKLSGVKCSPLKDIIEGNSNYTIDSLLKVCNALEIKSLGNVKEQG